LVSEESIKKQLHKYAIGKTKHTDIFFTLTIKDTKTVNELIKIFIEDNKNNNKDTLYKIDGDKMKRIIFECAEMQKKFNSRI